MITMAQTFVQDAFVAAPALAHARGPDGPPLLDETIGDNLRRTRGAVR